MAVEGLGATAERFYPDGAYSKRTRGLRLGRYRIQGDDLCVSLESDQHTSCRRYARDAQGRIYLVRFRDGEAEPWSGAAPVRILPLSSYPEATMPNGAVHSHQR